jgi:hypothetical protein
VTSDFQGGSFTLGSGRQSLFPALIGQSMPGWRLAGIKFPCIRPSLYGSRIICADIAPISSPLSASYRVEAGAWRVRKVRMPISAPISAPATAAITAAMTA